MHAAEFPQLSPAAHFPLGAGDGLAPAGTQAERSASSWAKVARILKNIFPMGASGSGPVLQLVSEADRRRGRHPGRILAERSSSGTTRVSAWAHGGEGLAWGGQILPVSKQRAYPMSVAVMGEMYG